MNAAPLSRAAARHRVLAILLIAGILRVALALLGGQRHYGDEDRYFKAVEVYFALSRGDLPAARTAADRPAHAGFSALVVAATPLHLGLVRLTGHPMPASAAELEQYPGFGAALLGLGSTASLWLLYRLARKAGAGREEALWGLLLAACSTSLLFYARHLLPYDASLALALAGLLLAWQDRRLGRLALGGLASGLAGAVYLGHWPLIPLSGVAVWFVARSSADRRRVILAWPAAALAGLILGALPGFLLGGAESWSQLKQFTGTITDGEFAEGWRLPGEFFWHAEGALALGLATLVLIMLARRPVPTQAVAWLLLAVGCYGLLVLASVGMEKFVVYGRTARPIWPFLCLAGGTALHVLTAARPRWRPMAAAALILAATANFTPLLVQRYAEDFDRTVQAGVGVPLSISAFPGTMDKRVRLPVTRPDLAIINTYPLFWIESYRGYPAGPVLVDVPHPLALRFYQYDGHRPAERALLRAHEPRMKLIRLEVPLRFVE